MDLTLRAAQEMLRTSAVHVLQDDPSLRCMMKTVAKVYLEDDNGASKETGLNPNEERIIKPLPRVHPGDLAWLDEVLASDESRPVSSWSTISGSDTNDEDVVGTPTTKPGAIISPGGEALRTMDDLQSMRISESENKVLKGSKEKGTAHVSNEAADTLLHLRDSRSGFESINDIRRALGRR